MVASEIQKQTCVNYLMFDIVPFFTKNLGIVLYLLVLNFQINVEIHVSIDYFNSNDMTLN